MVKKTICPVCKSSSITELYELDVPVLQNKVFNEQIDARSSNKGHISFTHCGNCSFVFNSTFDNSLLVYDTDYDNSVPSKLFENYYSTIADYLYKKYNLKNGILYDIGCGKGTFLKLICSKYSDVKGIGIDPSYEGELNYSENLTFIRDFFNINHAKNKPNLVLSRHVFEHLESPVEFLNLMSDALIKFKDVPFFIEVPDLNWITKNFAYWDLCYEHCNYFNPLALNKMLTEANTKLVSIKQAFNGQYIWCEGVLNNTNLNFSNTNSFSFSFNENELKSFTNSIKRHQSESIKMIGDYKNNNYNVVVWGMATKGVEYCNIVDSQKLLIDFCIDINSNKQNKFIPFTGHKILNPNELLNCNNPLLIIVMNPNYLKEIKDFFCNNNLIAEFVNAHGNKLI